MYFYARDGQGNSFDVLPVFDEMNLEAHCKKP